MGVPFAIRIDVACYLITNLIAPEKYISNHSILLQRVPDSLSSISSDDVIIQPDRLEGAICMQCIGNSLCTNIPNVVAI